MSGGMKTKPNRSGMIIGLAAALLLLMAAMTGSAFANEGETPAEFFTITNINGSFCAVEGITSPDGRVLGKMTHSERRGDSVAVNIYGNQDLQLFRSGVSYFE